MDRTAALAYLVEQFGTIATELGVTATDNAAGYKGAIDAALRLVGTAEADLATADITSDVSDYLAALDYTALLRFWRMASVRVDIAVGEPSVNKKRGDLFKHLGELLKSAKAAAENAGVLTGESSWAFSRFTLDYLEPSLADQ